MRDEGDPRHRALLEGAAGVLYKEVVERGVLSDDDPRSRPGVPGYDAFSALCDLGLLRRDEGVDGFVAVDPSLVQAGVVGPIGRRAVELLADSAAWATALSDLGQAYRRTPKERSPLTEIRGIGSINRFLESAVDDAEHELLTAQPRGARRPDELGRAVNRDVRALQRGLQMRTLYQHTARSSRATRDYVALMLDRGAHVRTLDEFFNRLIVLDRRIAVIPGDAPDVALVVREPILVEYLVDLFDKSWERGRDYELRPAPKESDLAREVRQLTVRMLSEGHSDSASAKRVGVSTRTYASYVAALKQEYGVDTRFQLGLAMGSEQTQSAPEMD